MNCSAVSNMFTKMIQPKTCLCLLLTVFVVSSLAKKCKISPTTCSGPLCPKKMFCSGTLIFEDEFNSFDFDKWQHEITLAGGGNWEFQWYLNNRSNSFAEDGKLHIRPTLTADAIGEENLSKMLLDITGGGPADQCTQASFWGCVRQGSETHILNPIRSARIRTVNSFSFKYGKIEVKARLPSGDWLWPAIWLLPTSQVYGTWPASGEIDIMESRGNKEIIVNGKNLGSEFMGSTLHWGPDPSHNAYERTHVSRNTEAGKGYDTNYTRFGAEWTPEYIKFFVDDDLIGTIQPNTSFWKFGEFDKTGMANPWIDGTNMAPFDQEFHILLNLAVGGTNGYFPDKTDNDQRKPWKNSSPAAATDFWNGRTDWLPTWKMDVNNGESSSMLIDYVKVWAL